MRSYKILGVLAVFVLMFNALLSPVLAQQPISYGDSTGGALGGTTSSQMYRFQGQANDFITLSVFSTASDFHPTITLLGARGQVGFSDHAGTQPFIRALLNAVLPDTGDYTVIIAGDAGGGSGEYLLLLDGQAMPESVALTQGETVTLSAETPSYVYEIEATDAPQQLDISTETAALYYVARVISPEGAVILSVDGQLPAVSLTLPAGSGRYHLVIEAADSVTNSDAAVEGTLAVQLNSRTSTAVTPVTPPVSGSTPSSNQCVAVPAAGGVNIRVGPSTNFNVVGNTNTSLPVIGRYEGWYQVTQGWVSGSVVTLQGDCSAVPTVSPDVTAPTIAAPTADTTATEESTTAPTDQPTEAPTDQPTQQPTEPATPDVAIAPVDNDPHNFVFDRDNGGSFSNNVSYPNGDTQDHINASVVLSQNQSRNVRFTIACAGTGTENLSFHRGSPTTQAYRCGQTIEYRFSHPYTTQPFYVVISGGSPSYVDYTIVATTSD